MSRMMALSKGKSTLLDNEDFKYLSKWSWAALSDGYNWYAVRSTSINSKKIGLKMHRVILDASSNMQVDHINGDSLDNRRVNLRFCTPAQNAANQSVVRGTSKFKGVYRRKAEKKWRAQIGISGQRKSLGTFANEEDAARAYDEAALRQFGEFAKTNKMLGLLE